MARIRTVKPEFFLHEDLADADHDTGLPCRLAFIGLWCCADREGRFHWRPRRLKAQILPFDDVVFADVLDQLESRGFIARYEVDGNEYGHIPSWHSHQSINQRESQSRLPDPDSDDARICTHVQGQQKSEGQNIPPDARKTVLARDGGKCVRCDSENDLTIDHIFPRSIGGTHAITNLRILCRSCNSARPVAGQALLDDLEKDGLSMADIESICMHVHARGEGKGREQGKEGKGKGTGNGKEIVRQAAPSPENRFDEFWALYPVRREKKKAHEIWKRRKLDTIADTICHDVRVRQQRDAQWKAGYIPHPTTYLRNDRWEDEYGTVKKDGADKFLER